MRISIIGLGYVGAVCAAVLAREGHDVVGVDSKPEKNACINQGSAPIYEPGLDALIKEGVAAGRLKANDDLESAIAETEMSFVCVGTPSREDGSVDLSFVQSVLMEIGRILKTADHFHTVIMRSTVPPGTGQDQSIPILESLSGRKVGEHFGYASNPEFLREGMAIHDFDNPPKTVIGSSDERTAQTVAKLYRRIDAPLIQTGIRMAEMVKYADNAWHANKVAFANEIGNIAKESGVDGQEVMRIFCLDTKLNISPYYMTPAFAFGGSCLPKDVKALVAMARGLGLRTPVLSSLMESNQEQIERGYAMVEKTGRKNIALLGISFKADTDDIRESPQVKLANRLLDEGYTLKVYDRHVVNGLRTSPSRDQLREALGRVADVLMPDLEQALEDAEAVIIGNPSREFEAIPERFAGTLSVVDLARVVDWESHDHYQGICW